MNELQFFRDEQQSRYAELFSKQLVVSAITMRGVSDNWMRHVVEVPSDLVFPTGQRLDAHFRIATARILAGGEWDFPSLQRFVFRDCWLRQFIIGRVAV